MRATTFAIGPIGGYTVKKRRMMRGVVICAFILIALLFLIYCGKNSYSANNSTAILSAEILSYQENDSYVEYPQIKGLTDITQQNAINTLLKEEMLIGAKTVDREPLIDFNSDLVYTIESRIGFLNEDITSFAYSLSGYSKNFETSWKNHFSRNYGITVDMKTGEKINLTDFMVVDERLLHSSDGTGLTTDYNSPANFTSHNFKDAFMIYFSEEEKDNYHRYTPQSIIDSLKDATGETNWYIDSDKNIVFMWIDNWIKLPYNEVSDLIYPQYLAALEK